jgi:hypothetical protein
MSYFKPDLPEVDQRHKPGRAFGEQKKGRFYKKKKCRGITKGYMNIYPKSCLN